MHNDCHSRSRGRVLLALFIASLGACKGESPTEPETPYPYNILLERREGSTGPADIYLLDLETGDAARVLSTGVTGMHPAAFPGGSLVAFVRTDAEFNSEIFTGGIGGTNLTNISNHAEADVMPTWSPNGQRLAFVTDRAGFQDIFVVNANGTNLRRVTPVDPAGSVTAEWWPSWSPDGSRIAYSSNIDGTPDIWTTAADASPLELSRLTGTIDADYHPTWSHDNTRIAFHRIDANTGDADIMILTLSTMTTQRISMPGQQLWPAWSPAGDLIAFSSNHEDTDFEIYTMRVDGTEVVRRTDNGANDLRPAWLIRPVTID